VGCHACVKPCPVECISGKVKEAHVIDKALCIGCGVCQQKCQFEAIDRV
jgi:Pyruvate/2-oxoacid:ferredoxin oxidoreductase delta subunit